MSGTEWNDFFLVSWGEVLELALDCVSTSEKLVELLLAKVDILVAVSYTHLTLPTICSV